MERWWDDTDRGKQTYWKKTCPSATESTTNFTRTWELNPVSKVADRELRVSLNNKIKIFKYK